MGLLALRFDCESLDLNFERLDMPSSRCAPCQFDIFDAHAESREKPKPRMRDYVVIEGNKIALTPVFYSYWKFAAERQNIFFKRVNRINSDQYTSDTILSEYKFTNAYRASDRVSQYLIRNVIYRSDLPQTDEEIFFRILLFKLFNKIETWEYLEKSVGGIRLSQYDFSKYDAALRERKAAGDRIYSAAYIMPSGRSAFGQSAKHQNHLLLLEHMLRECYPEKLRQCHSMAEAYALMLSAPSIGPFLAYQYVTDLNYSRLINFSEADFVIAGPGALDGIDKCFRGLNGIPAESVIKYMFENQHRYFLELSLKFRSLWGRPLQLIDCQNLFCEISKYARVAFPQIEGISGRKRIKQKFATSGSLPTPWYPPKWGINQSIQECDYFNESPASEIAKAVQPTIF